MTDQYIDETISGWNNMMSGPPRAKPEPPIQPNQTPPLNYWEDKMPPQPKSYWSDPVRVASMYNAYQALPDKTQIPQWFNPDVVSAAYTYYDQMNPGKNWWEWKAPENDEMGFILSELPPPPKEALHPYEQDLTPMTQADYDTISATQMADPNGRIASIPASDVQNLPPEIQNWLVQSQGEKNVYTVTQQDAQFISSLIPQEQQVPDAAAQIKQLKDNGTWAQLGPVQQFMLNLNASQFGGAATGALQGAIPAAFNLLQGPRGVPGALTAIGMGAGLGQLSAGDPKSPMTQAGQLVMNAFNVGAETITRMAGMVGQLAGSAMAPEWYGSLAQLMQQLPEAWQAADITYAAAHPFKNEVVVHQLGQPGSVTLQGEEADALKQISNLRNDLAAIYEGRSPKTLDEVLYGYKEAQPIVDKYMGKFGLEGAARDMIFQLVADPINFSGVGLAKSAEKIATRMGMDTLAKTYRSTRYIGGIGKALSEVQTTLKEEGAKAALRSPAVTGYTPAMDGGLISTLQRYIDDVKLEPEKYTDAELNHRFIKWATGMVKDEDGKWKEWKFTPEGRDAIAKGTTTGGRFESFIKRIPYQFIQTPESAAKESIQNLGDAWAHAAHDPNVSVDKTFAMGKAIAHQDRQEMAAVGMGVEKNQFDKFAPDALNAEKEIDAIQANWENTVEQRNLVNLIGEDLKSGERADLISKDPQTYYDRAVYRLKVKAEAGDKVAAEKLKIIAEIPPEEFGRAAKDLVVTKAPVDEEHVKVQVGTAILEKGKDWLVDWFGVTENPTIHKFAQTIKNMESFMLLFPNPTFMFQNVMSNTGHLLADGLTSWMDKGEVDKYWDRIGWRPSRLREGIGEFQDTIGGTKEALTLTSPIMEEVGKIVKGKSMNPNIELVMGRIKRFFKGGMTALSNKNEQYMGEQAGTQFLKITHDRLARVGYGIDPIDAGGKATLDGLDPALSARLEAVMNGRYNASEVDNAAKIAQNVALNPTDEQRDALRNFQMDEILKDSLDKAGDNVEKQRDAFDEVLALSNEVMSETQKETIEKLGIQQAQITTAVQGEQAIPVLRQEMNEKSTLNQINHQVIMDQIWSEAATLTGKKKSQFLTKRLNEEHIRERRFEQAYEAQSVGIAKGLGIEPETTGLRIAIHNGVLNHKEFFNGKMKLERLISNMMGDDPDLAIKSAKELEPILAKELGEGYDPLVAPQDNVRKVVTERYKVMIDNEEKIQDEINNIFLNHLLNSPDKAGYNGFKDYLKIQKENRRATTGAELYFRTGEGNPPEEVKKQIDDLLGGYTMDQLRQEDPVEYRKKWDKFQNEVYTPLWYKNLETAREAEYKAIYESRGMAPSTAPKVEEVAPVAQNRFEPLDRATTKEELVEAGKLYGFANGVAIQKFVNKHLGNELSWKKGEITPQILKDALSTLTDEEFAQRWTDSFPGANKAEMPDSPTPILSGDPESVQKVATPPMFEAQDEEYANFVKLIGDLKRDYMSQEKKVYTGGILDDIKKTAEAKGLDPTPYLKVAQDYLAKGKQQIKDVNFVSAKMAMKMRDFTLLNYDNRSKFDHNLQLLMPYSFWYTHSMANWAVRALDRPGLMASYAKLKNFLDAIDNDPNQPTRLKGKFFVPVPWMPDWMGKGLYVDPLRNIIPIDNFLRPIQQWDQNQTTQYKSTISILNDMIDNEKITYDQATEAAKNKSGDIWDTAWAQAGKQMDAPEAMDYATMLMAPHMPLMWIQKAMRGKAEDIAQLPFTRAVQNITGGLGIKSDQDMFGGLISPEGVNLEAWIRTPLGLQRSDKFQDYRIDRQLAVMAAEQPEMTDELTKAMIDRSGPLYNEAVSRVMKVNLSRWLGSTLALDFFPEGELDQRKLRAEYAKASDAYANGDTKALNNFFDKYPEYQTQQNVWRDPAQRMKMYLRSQIWQTYNALPDLYKKEAAASFGSLFQDAFLNKETRSYDSIDVNTLASWAKSLGANTPGSVEASQIPLNLSSQKDAQLVQNFNDLKDQNFPNLNAIYEYANSLPPDQRDAFLNSQREVQGFNQMKNSFLSQYPNLADSVNSQTNELNGLPTSIQGAVYTYRDQKAQLFPNIEQVQSQYFSLVDPVQKSAYMLDHPELEEYWNWRGKYAANFPEASPYILSDQNIKGALGGTNFNVEQAFPGIYDVQSEYFSYPKGSQGRRYFLSQHPELKLYWDWKGFYGDEMKAEDAFAKTLEPVFAQMSTELKSNLVGHFTAGQSLSSGAMMELKKIYNQNRMGGDFNSFVESLKSGL
jgi:hypothetical protein